MISLSKLAITVLGVVLYNAASVHAQDLPRRFKVVGIDSNDRLMIHKGPGANYHSDYKVSNSTGGIEILEGPVMNGSDDWVHILFTDREGWVRPKYLRVEEISASDKINFQRAVTGNNVPMAARYVRPEFVNEPFRANPDDPADYEAYPPIETAALYGYTKLFILLAEHGGDMKYRIDAGPLAYIAAARGHYDTAETALKYGGGTEADIARGKGHYALSQINPNAFALGFAVVCTAAALNALSDGSSSSASNREKDDTYEALHITAHQLGDTKSPYW